MNLLPKTKSLSRKIDKLSAIGLVVCSALTTSFLPFESSYAYSVFNKNGYIAQAKQTTLTQSQPMPGPSKGSYNDFLNALAQRETGPGNPTYNNTKNQWGFIGKYQFGEALLIDIGYYKANSYYGQPGVDKNYWRGTWTGKHGVNSKEEFLNNKNNVQEKAIREAMQYKWGLIKNELNGRSIKEFIRQKRRGIVVTESGILAAAHLRGEKGVARLLLNNEVSQDESGTSILAYLSEFAGYQIPFH